MSADRVTGLFGKLPAHGDFIHRNLPTDFINPWDEWLQHFIASTQQQMGEAWLDIYLTSPIWRFVFSPGVIDQHSWAGIVMPSVDRVGRYFPFSVLTRLSSQLNPLDFLSQQNAWFVQIEDIALQALDAEIMADELIQEITAVDCDVDGYYLRNGSPGESSALVIELMSEAAPSTSSCSHLLDAVLTRTYASYSVWSTLGSERVAPCMFTVQGLPPIDGVPAMLDGHWQHWNWQQPYTLRTT